MAKDRNAVNRFTKIDKMERKVLSMSVSMYPRDYELLDQLAKYLGCSRSEACRTAIRGMVAQLGFLKK